MVTVQRSWQTDKRVPEHERSQAASPKQRLALVVCDGSLDLEDTVSDLRTHGFMAVVATSVRQAVRLFPRLRPHIVVATASLPNCGWLTRSVAETSTPVVLVGSPDQLLGEEKTDALEAKILAPAQAEEIAIAAEALVTSDGNRTATEVLIVGPMRIDTTRHIVSINGRDVELPRREFDLLFQLTLHRAAPLTTFALASLAWPDNPFATAADVYRHVYALRTLLGNYRSCPVSIRVRRGVGYQLETVLQETEADRS